MTSTDIVKWRKTNDYENFEKGMMYMKILKKGGVVEKRGEEETRPMPHAPVNKRRQRHLTRSKLVLPYYGWIIDQVVLDIIHALTL